MPPDTAGVAVVPYAEATFSAHTGPGLVVNFPPTGTTERKVPLSVRLSPKKIVLE